MIWRRFYNELSNENPKWGGGTKVFIDGEQSKAKEVNLEQIPIAYFPTDIIMPETDRCYGFCINKGIFYASYRSSFYKNENGAWTLMESPGVSKIYSVDGCLWGVRKSSSNAEVYQFVNGSFTLVTTLTLYSANASVTSICGGDNYIFVFESCKPGTYYRIYAHIYNIATKTLSKYTLFSGDYYYAGEHALYRNGRAYFNRYDNNWQNINYCTTSGTTGELADTNVYGGRFVVINNRLYLMSETIGYTLADHELFLVNESSGGTTKTNVIVPSASTEYVSTDGTNSFMVQIDSHPRTTAYYKIMQYSPVYNMKSKE